MTTQVLAAIGFLLSVYAFYVSEKFRREKGYKPLCDVSKNISCTKVFGSKYARVAFVPNSFVGIFFYSLVFGLDFYSIGYVFHLSLLAVLASLYLAYVSYFKLRTICPVCTAVYVINAALLVYSF